MGKKRKGAVVSNADVAAVADVPAGSGADSEIADIPVVDDDDVCSNRSMSSVVTISTKLRAMETQVRVKTLEEEADREMKLVEELATLKRQDLEIRKCEIEQKLEIQKRLSAAKREAFLTLEPSLLAGSVIDDPIYAEPPHVQATAATKVADDHDFLDHSVSIIPQNMTSLTDLVNALKQIPNLPSVKMTTFNGDPANFIEFRTSFKLQIEPIVQNDVERFLRLLYSCEGKAKDAIQGCIHLPPGQMYQTAWRDLTENFGRPYMVAEGQMKRLREHQVRRHDAESLLAFARRLEEIHRAMSSMGESYLARLNDDELLRKLMRKLPSESLQRRWVEKVGSLLEVQHSVSMKDFIDFVKTNGTRSNNVFGNDLKTNSNKSLHGSSFALSADDPPEQGFSSKAKDCCLCGNSHPIWKCRAFCLKSVADRFGVVKKAKLCLRCLRKEHFVRDCRFNLKCAKCQSRRHNTLLHKEENLHNESSNQTSAGEVTVGSTSTTFSAVWLKVLPVRVSANGRCIETYAFLDAGSDTSLCSQSLIDSLRLKGKPLRYQLSTISGVKNQSGSRVNFSVSSLDSQTSFDLSCLSVAKIPISDENIARSDDLKRYLHLQDIELPNCQLQSVSLLIGADYSMILDSQLDRRTGGLNEPVAIKTCLGWTVSGPVGKKENSTLSINRIECQEDVLKTDFERLFNNDFGDLLSDRKALSPDDKRASDLMNSSVSLRDGHYHIDLPFKKDPKDLRGNFSLAESRLQHLKRRLERNSNLKTQYCRVIKKYENEGAASICWQSANGGTVV